MNKFMFILILILLASCRSHLKFSEPIATDNTFQQSTATPNNISKYQQAADYSRDHDGRAILIIQGNRIVFEQYHHGHKAETPHHIFSGTKSFAGVMAIAAIADGKIKLDEKIAATIPEFAKDPRKAKVTVRHLLNFTSGLDQSFLWLSWDGMLESQRLTNKYKYALTLDVESEPGEKFVYGSSHLMVFGEFMRRKLKGDPLAYLEYRIFKPIGFHYSGWNRDPAGNPMLPYGAWTTAREWAKFGVLMRDAGKWKNKQILPPGMVAKCFQGSQAMPAYGLTFWLLNRKVPTEKLDGLPKGLRKKV